MARDNLFAAAECVALSEYFAIAAIPLLHLKGVTLSELAHGDPFIKMSADIDLLVPPDRIAEAAIILKRRGFRLVVPACADLIAWHHRNKESVWLRTGAPVALSERNEPSRRSQRSVGQIACVPSSVD